MRFGDGERQRVSRNTWIVTIVILAVWEAVCRLQWVPGVLLPAPSAIATVAGESWKEFALGMRVTLMEMAAAAAIACVTGIALGTLLGRSALASAAASPLLTAAFAVPLITWYPLFMTWFGLGSASKIAYGAVSGIFPIALGTINGLRGVDSAALLFGRSVGCDRFTLFTRIVLPLALPSIVTGMRIGLALTVIGVIATEMLSSLDGVGFLISYNRSMFNTAHVYLGILLALLCAWGVNCGLTTIERRFSAWRTDAQG